MTEKELGQIRVTRTETGIRLDIEGKDLKDLCSCCCIVTDKSGKAECCPPETEEK
jgi:hypothetical protein